MIHTTTQVTELLKTAKNTEFTSASVYFRKLQKIIEEMYEGYSFIDNSVEIYKAAQKIEALARKYDTRVAFVSLSLAILVDGQYDYTFNPGTFGMEEGLFKSL